MLNNILEFVIIFGEILNDAVHWKNCKYTVIVYGALDVRLFPNKRLNFDLKNIEI